MKQKHYESYEAYIDHQTRKIKEFPQEVAMMNNRIKEILADRYKDKYDFKGKTVLCLGARLGGEVAAFKQLGSLAIGLDIEPGWHNPHVLYGDFHRTNFPDEVFDFVYCNSVDHAFDLDTLFIEVRRLLKKKGIFLMETAVQVAGEFESIDTSDISDLTPILEKYFTLMSADDINNVWKGVLFVLKNCK